MNLAFIGGGNMAHAMVGGMHDGGIPLASVHVLEPDVAKGAELARRFGVTAHAAGGEWLRGAQTVVLAVKPQQAREAVSGSAPYLDAPLVLSIVAGVRGDTLARWFGHRRIVRAMPNTPALIRAGITGAVALAGVSAVQRADAELILRSIGQVLWLDEEAMLDPVTAVSGSGPAYAFYFIEALQQAALDMGFSAPQARTLAVETFVGAALLAQQSDEAIAVLRGRVTSKGGTTAAALAVLDHQHVRDSIVAAVHAARDRATQLGEEFDAAGERSDNNQRTHR
jgi:pyrroline-5-carboxylate reductase